MSDPTFHAAIAVALVTADPLLSLATTYCCRVSRQFADRELRVAVGAWDDVKVELGQQGVGMSPCRWFPFAVGDKPSCSAAAALDILPPGARLLR